MKPLFESNLKSLPLVYRGKVRDIYAVGEEHFLIVATDRISAFDVVLPTPIPGKGKVLTSLSHFWFNKMEHIVPNHVENISIKDIISDPNELEQVLGRSMVVRNLESLPIEAIVRGYLCGSGYKDYKRTGMISGVQLPPDLGLGWRLDESIFTPSTKAEVGDHDENISFDDMVEILGEDIASQVRDVSLRIYEEALEIAISRGIIIADTKFEFGLDKEGNLVLIDELLTPDSSRFWSLYEFLDSGLMTSLDKQFVRDYLETLDWDKEPPGPELPEEIVEKTSSKYYQILDRF